MNPEEQQPTSEQPAEKLPGSEDGAQNTPVVQDVVAPTPPSQQSESSEAINTPALEPDNPIDQPTEAASEPPQEVDSAPQVKTKQKKNKTKVDPGLTKQYKPKKTSSTPLAFVVTVVAVALALMGLVVMSYLNQDEIDDTVPTSTEEAIEPNGALPEPQPPQDDTNDDRDIVTDPDEPVSSDDDDVTDETNSQPTNPNEVPAEQ